MTVQHRPQGLFFTVLKRQPRSASWLVSIRNMRPRPSSSRLSAMRSMAKANISSMSPTSPRLPLVYPVGAAKLFVVSIDDESVYIADRHFLRDRSSSKIHTFGQARRPCRCRTEYSAFRLRGHCLRRRLKRKSALSAAIARDADTLGGACGAADFHLSVLSGLPSIDKTVSRETFWYD